MNTAWVKKVRPLRKKPGPKPKPPQVIELGYVVKMSKARTGCDATMWLAENSPVGMSGNLQKAVFFSTKEVNHPSGDALTRASSYAHWQLGTVMNARKVNGVIEVV